ncbi:HDIG domain-containing metalloprotein [Streptomyces parvulus]|uniref:HDIG domain-containing protein n=1 Tax=Streptomyces parvulus TaxID=146923 RepID=A0A369UXL1_9ACTN|nr:HDIG domain-containing metalloprotein [Streptomyces parvulus]RDD85522.1 HDIG domain-containing protein [Streptomyces parvulus]
MPSALDTPRGAAELSESLLPQLGNRWLHTQAVAARAQEATAAVSKADRDLLVAAAWLHDIGYAPELRDTGFHPLDGARHLESLGAPARLVALVAHHSGAVYEAEQRCLSEELAVYEREDSAVLDALIFADMTTGPAGQSFEFDQRIDEILVRYEPGSEVHNAISRARPYLGAAVERTKRRMAAFTSLPPSQRAFIDGSRWWPPTLFAVEHQDVELLARLLDAGADPDEGNGATPLTHAVETEGDSALQSGDPLTVATTAVLLAYGADPDLPDATGETPLQVAERYNHAPAIRLLRRYLPGDRSGKRQPI